MMFNFFLRHCFTLSAISTLLTPIFLYPIGLGPTTEISPNVTGDVSCCGNSKNNQFLFAWSYGLNVYCVIYNANGTVAVSTTSIGSGGTSVPFSSYNSIKNQFLITWSYGNIIYFSILYADGTTYVRQTMITGSASNTTSVTCCYNKESNQYFIIVV